MIKLIAVLIRFVIFDVCGVLDCSLGKVLSLARLVDMVVAQVRNVGAAAD